MRFLRQSLLTLSVLALIGLSLVLVDPVFAQPVQLEDVTGGTTLGQFAQEAGLSTGTSLPEMIVRLIRTFLTFSGIILVIIIIYGGFVWMTSGGNPQRVEKAKKIIISSLIGIVIVLSSFAIVQFVLNQIVDATGGKTTIETTNPPPDPKITPPTYFGLTDVNTECASVLRNFQLQLVFSKPVNPTTVTEGLRVQTNDRTEIEGTWSTVGQKVTFTPNASCPAPYESAKCFLPNINYELLIDATVIKSTSGSDLSCSSGGICGSVKFKTGQGIDLTPPVITMSSPASAQPIPVGSIYSLQATTTDDTGVSSVDFFVVDSKPLITSGLSLSTKSRLTGQDQPNAFNTDPNKQWDTAGYVTNKAYPVWASGSDCAGNTTVATKVFPKVVATNCGNKVKDADEEKVDCGGNPSSPTYCGACVSAPCTTDAECASGVCEAGQCVNKLRIDAVSPGDGASGNLVTISGVHFGATGGKVTFVGQNDTQSIEASSYACEGNAQWSDTQIVVQVPSGANDGPIVVESTTGEKDGTNDTFGPLSADFDINAIKRPGLCAVIPNQANQQDDVWFYGLGFGNTKGTSELYFKNFLSPASLAWLDTAVHALVPNMTAGQVKTQLFTGDYQCLNASKQPTGTVCEVDKDCGDGNTCATKWCSETLAYCTTDADCGEFGGICTSVRVGSNKLAFTVQDPLPPGEAPVISYVDTGWKACDGDVNNGKMCGSDADCGGVVGDCVKQPDWGPRGQYVTIFGSGFGTSGGFVRFRDENDNVANGMADFPDECGESFWTDTAIIVKVPFDYAGSGQIIEGSYALTVERDSLVSDPIDFKVVSGTPGPAICLLDPVSGKVGTEVDVYGEYFGSQPGTVNFYSVTSPVSVPYTVWSSSSSEKNTVFNAEVIEGVQSGPVQLQKPNGQTSNPYNFTVKECPTQVTCGPNMQCCGDGTCRATCAAVIPPAHFAYKVSTGSIPVNPTIVVECSATKKSPAPWEQWHGTQQVCLNAAVSGSFSVQMDEDTIIDRVLVEACTNGSEKGCTNWNVLDGVIETSTKGFVWYPNVLFPAETRIRVKVVGGIGGVKSHQSKGYLPMLEDYSWEFVTGPTDFFCEVGDVLVQESKNIATSKGEEVSHTALLVDKKNQCVTISPKGNNFLWTSSNYAKATLVPPSSGDKRNNVKATALEETQETPVLISTQITNAPGQPSGSSELTIDFSDPSVSGYFPNCATACVNVKPWFRFASAINIDTLTANAVKLFECTNALCAAGTLSATNLVTQVSCDPDPTKPGICPAGTPVYLTISQSLKANAWYRLILDGNIIKSPSNVLLKSSGSNSGTQQNLYYLNDFSWKFKTKSSDVSCGIDRISIAPASKVLKLVGERQSYVATGYGAPDECDLSGQALQDVNYTWNAWTAVDTPDKYTTAQGGSSQDVAFLFGNGSIGVAKQLPAYCSAHCLRTGAPLNITQAVCGDGEVNKVKGVAVKGAELCDDGNTVNGDGCSSICLKEGTVACTATKTTGCCGNKVIEAGELCDDDNTKSGDGCSAQCLNEGSQAVGATCGNGVVDFDWQTGGEDCDDSNTKSGDGCSANCLYEGSVTQSSAPVCGDGAENQTAEDCDDGNAANGDGCSSVCLHEGSSTNYATPSVCGDTKIGTGEDCDYGDKLSGDGCSSSCLNEGSSIGYATPSFCGDADQKLGEECEAEISKAKAVGGFAVAEISPTAPQEVLAQGQQIAYSVISASVGNVTETAQLGIECSCKTDASCGDSSTKACGAGSCCFTRPTIGTVLPASNATGLCRNTALSVEFSQKMDDGSFGKSEGSQLANIRVRLVKKDGKLISDNPSLCPASYYKIASAEPSGNFFVRAWVWLKSLFTREATAANQDCFVNLAYMTQPLKLGGQKVVLEYTELLEPGAEYQIEVVGDDTPNDGLAQGVLSQNKVGLCLNGTCEPLFSSKFSTGDQVCQLDQVSVVDTGKVTKKEYESASPYFFSKTGEEHEFISEALSYHNNKLEPIQSVPAYAWTWGWGTSINISEPTDVVKNDPSTSTSAQVMAQGAEGEEHVIATAFITATEARVDGSARVTALLCENPWPSLANFPYIEDTENTNFGFYYCRDQGAFGVTDDLPDLIGPVDVTSVSFPDPTNVPVQELLFPVNGTSDAIGVRVYGNPEYLSPEAWFVQKGFTGSYTAIQLDGYSAIQSGNTAYVAAANQTGNELYSNLYVISYNPSAGPEAKEIFKQILDHWRFNANADEVSDVGLCRAGHDLVQDNAGNFIECTWDGDCLDEIENNVCTVSQYSNEPQPTTSCPLQQSESPNCGSQKAKIQRDLTRLLDVTTTISYLDAYGNSHKHCSVTKGQSCNSNPDCPGTETCVAGYPALNQGTFVPSMSVSKWDSWNVGLSSELGKLLPVDPLNRFWNDCPLGSGYDPATCFNGLEGKFVCPAQSHVYGYRSVGGEAYALYTQLEYKGAPWQSKVDKYTDDAVEVVAEYGSSTAIAGLLANSGFVNGAEFCDGSDWGVSTICGDGVKGGNEQCEIGQTKIAAVNTACAPGYPTGTITQNCKLDCTGFEILPGAQCIPYQCGNGVKEQNELCDDGVLNGTYGHCGSDCTMQTANYCGDGYLAGGEQCDCGTVSNQSSVLADQNAWWNTTVFAQAMCGVSNGQYQKIGSCSFDCKSNGPSCGDLIINGAEQCDGGNETWAGALCSDGKTACTTATDCPSGYTCGGSVPKNKACTSQKICVGTGPRVGLPCSGPLAVSCSNGSVCSTKSYPLTHSRICLDKSEDALACTWGGWSACRGGDQFCGNGTVEGTEQCDDGNQTDNDACTNTCEKNVCGDGIVYSGVEACDNGLDNKLPSDTNPCNAAYGGTCNYCTSQCQYKTTSGSYCGDNVRQTGEFCDGSDVPKHCNYKDDNGNLVVGNECESPADCDGTQSCSKVGVCNGGSYNGDACVNDEDDIAVDFCGIDSQSKPITCTLPVCADDCSGACPFSFQEAILTVKADLPDANVSQSVDLYSFLNLEKQYPDSATIQFPACAAVSQLSADVTSNITYPNVDVVFVTDLSGSMNKSPANEDVFAPNRRIDIVADALEDAVDTLFNNYPGALRIGLVAYSGNQAYNAMTNPKFGGTGVGASLVNGDPQNRQRIKEAINLFTSNASGGTPTAAGVNEANQILDINSADEHIKIIVLLSDGDPSRNKKGEDCLGFSQTYQPESGGPPRTVKDTAACVAEVRYGDDMIKERINQLNNKWFFYSAAIANDNTLRAYMEHMSSMGCSGTSLGQLTDCEQGLYAFTANTKEGIKTMYDQIINAIMASTTTVSYVNNGKITPATKVTPVGLDVTLPLPSTFQCKNEPFDLPLTTQFYGTGTMKFDNIRVKYCPLP